MIAPGVCRHCGCRDGDRCRLYDGDECCFVDRSRLVCSRPECVQAEGRRVKDAAAQARPKYRGWGYGAIVAEKRREDAARRRAARKSGRL